MIRGILKIGEKFLQRTLKKRQNLHITDQRISLTNILRFNYAQKKQSLEDLVQEVELLREQFQKTRNVNDTVMIQKEIVLTFQKYDYDSIFNNEDNFEVFIQELVGLMCNYLTLYPFSHSIVKLDNNILNPLVNREYINILSRCTYEEEQKLLYSTKLQAIGALSEILRDGMTTMSIERLHELMNEYLDCYELEISYSGKYETLQNNQFYLLGQMELSNFYFLISKIVLEKNQNDEFLRFIVMGLEQTESTYDVILNNIRQLSNEEQNWILDCLIQYPKLLLDFYEIVQNNSEQIADKMFLLDYLNKVKVIGYKIWTISINQITLLQQLSLAVNFSVLESDDQAIEILKFVYDERHRIQNEDYVYDLLAILYKCIEKTNNQQFNQNNIIKEMNSLQHVDKQKQILFKIEVTTYNSQFEVKQFNSLIESNQYNLLSNQSEKIVSLFEVHCDLILNNNLQVKLKYKKAILNIFKFIDQLVLNEEIPQRKQYVIRIYDSLQKVSKIQLSNEKQEYEKQFYLTSLYLLESEWQNKYPKDFINQLKSIYRKDFQLDFFNKVISLGNILLHKENFSLCQELFDFALNCLQDKQNSQKFIKQLEIILQQKEMLNKIK